MSFQENKLQLKNIFNMLKQQSANTGDNWNDSIQQRFYEQFISSLPNEFYSYINYLDKLDKSYENAENNINDLLAD